MLVALFCLGSATGSSADDLPEYQVKAAILYNFTQFTEWPASVGPVLDLCVAGRDPFGAALDALDQKPVGARRLRVRRLDETGAAAGCHILYLSASKAASPAATFAEIDRSPVLTVADTPGSARRGVMLNMAVSGSKVTFEVNLQSARAAGLSLSSKVLRLATDVIQ